MQQRPLRHPSDAESLPFPSHSFPASGYPKRYGRAARVLCPLKECADLLGEKDKMVLGEEAMEEALKSAGIIVADPLYRPICPGDSIFYELPHVAFSGRIYF